MPLPKAKQYDKNLLKDNIDIMSNEHRGIK